MNSKWVKRKFIGKSQVGVSREGLPSPVFYYKKIFPRITKGGEWQNVCCCFHKDSNPSLAINLSSGGFFCFSCGAKGGDVIAFHRQKFDLGFKEAVAQLNIMRREEVKCPSIS